MKIILSNPFSKLHTLRALVDVYENWFSLLKVYLTSRKSIVKLRKKLCKDDIYVEIKKDNINEYIYIAKLFYEFSNYIKELNKYNDKYWIIITVDGLKWLVRKGIADDIRAGPLLHLECEAREWEWISSLLGSSGIFVDVGAYIGGYTVRVSKICRKVIALEPDIENYSILVKNIELNKCTNVVSLKLAAGSTEERRPLFSSQYPASFSLVANVNEKNIRDIVEVKPLDNVIPPIIKNSYIDVMKIDVEGFEMNVIRGAQNVLKKTKYLIIEVWNRNRTRVVKILNNLGFKVLDMIIHYPNINHFNIILENTNKKVS